MALVFGNQRLNESVHYFHLVIGDYNHLIFYLSGQAGPIQRVRKVEGWRGRAVAPSLYVCLRCGFCFFHTAFSHPSNPRLSRIAICVNFLPLGCSLDHFGGFYFAGRNEMVRPVLGCFNPRASKFIVDGATRFCQSADIKWLRSAGRQMKTAI